MTPERWEQIKEIFRSVLDLEADERVRFLDEACAGDADLRREVESLLEYEETAKNFMESPILEVASEMIATEPGVLAAGQVIGRYRVISLLGRGGMGEVYRGDDLKLGHPVALKFLPARLAHDGVALARLIQEVCVARRITHPNVCRVHDIGEVDGRHFLTMEYIDGEDLASLLRRIGRLPADKGVEIARQICAGLAAAHESGVLHRDLKPANVMIDGRGKARITDFGLAGLAQEFRSGEVLAGTPAYMAPEQLKGKGVTPKSDIYSLGLVFYEIFTGRRAFEAEDLAELLRLHEKSTPAPPSSWVKGLDPLIERVILRCLEKDPEKRPASAFQVSAALPGGDPLQAALAAGEMPSPEMVAAAGERIGLHPAIAVSCLLAVTVGLVVAALLGRRVRLLERVPLDNPPEVLARKVREIIGQLGYPGQPTNTAYGFAYDRRYLNYIEEVDRSAHRWDRLAQGQPAAVYFWHRESPQHFKVRVHSGQQVTGGPPALGRVTEGDPALVTPGSFGVRLDTLGRLIRFSAVLPSIDESFRPSPQPDWAALFSAAGLDPTRFAPTEPKWMPQAACDTRAAWAGVFPERPEIPLRVEAAAWRGKPVYFEIIGSWAEPETIPAQTVARGRAARVVIRDSLLFAVLIWAVVQARRNLRQGQGDRRGASKLAVFIFMVIILHWVVGAHHVPTVHEYDFLKEVLGWALFYAGALWLAYVAFEPYVRRRWPVALITWNRVLAGGFRDPLVGRELLYGVLAGVIVEIIRHLDLVVRNRLAEVAGPGAGEPVLSVLPSMRYAASQFLALAGYPIVAAFSFLFVIFLLRVLLRRQWLVAGLFILIFAGHSLITGNWAAAVFEALVYGIYFVALVRHGLLLLVATLFAIHVLANFPITSDFSAWYVGTSISALLAVLALAVYGFHTSLAGRPVFQGRLLEE